MLQEFKQEYVLIPDVFAIPAEDNCNVNLTQRADAWKDFFDLVHFINDSDDFMSDRPMNIVPQEKGVFDDVVPHEGEES